MVAVAGTAQAGKQRSGYKNDFFAAGKELGCLVKHGCVYDCLVVAVYKIIYLFCDDWVND